MIECSGIGVIIRALREVSGLPFTFLICYFIKKKVLLGYICKAFVRVIVE